MVAPKGVTIELEPAARAWLATKGFDRAFGARPMARLIDRVVKKPLAEALLFGALANGGAVRLAVKDEATARDKIGFEFVEGPVTPKPEKLPGARKRSTSPRKPRPPGGPSGGGGSKVPPSRGPLVKA
jgi:ATP-dependent Clp protease ATP-binding subunit ClpA